MNYILNEGSKGDVEKIKTLMIKSKMIEAGCIFDFMLGEYNQILVNLYQTIITYWIHKNAAKPIIAIGENENEYLLLYLKRMAISNRIELRTIISTSKELDGSIYLTDITSMNMNGVIMLILSPESGALGILNEYKKIYEHCHKNGIMMFSDLTYRVERRASFYAHIGLAELGCIGGPAGYHILYINKLVAEAIYPDKPESIHIYSNNIYMAVSQLFEFILNDSLDGASKEKDKKKLKQKKVQFDEPNSDDSDESDDEKTISIRKIGDDELTAAIGRYTSFLNFIKKKVPVEILKYSTFIKKSQPSCIICSSSAPIQFGDKSPRLSLTFVKNGSVVSHTAISSHLKKLIMNKKPIPFIRFSQHISDTYKSKAIYVSFIQNTSIDPLCDLVSTIFN